MLISIVIRTLNEEKHLDELLEAIAKQDLPKNWSHEVVIVDSGSTDNTLAIAKRHACNVHHIAKKDFTFGRSLNLGCDQAKGDIIVMVSGHCVPTNEHWLKELTIPIAEKTVAYTYGRQLGRDGTKYSETRVFEKFFPARTLIPQQGFFTNNANAALNRETFEKYRFDETLTGLEDMHLARRLVEGGGLIGYIAESCVYHIHDESWPQVRNRYEREAIALATVMPEVHFDFPNFVSAFGRSVLKDSFRAMQAGRFFKEVGAILLFRFNQFWGGFQGMRLAKSIARIKSKNYFYPDRVYIQQRSNGKKSNRPSTDESTQQPSAAQELQGHTGKTTLPLDAGHAPRPGLHKPGGY